MTANPLLDVLFRATDRPAQRASAAPVRQQGTHSRAGNAMGRTRTALLGGAAEAARHGGTTITMSAIAAAAGVAKATLYNHFRTREAVLSALLTSEVDDLIAAARALPLDEALVRSAAGLSEHPVLSALRRSEPATIARLAVVDVSAPEWRRAWDAVRHLLDESARGGADTVLRWLASFLVTPASRAGIAADVAVLVAGLPAVDAPADPFFALLSR
jgi:AcrR family transcriptional regulator